MWNWIKKGTKVTWKNKGTENAKLIYERNQKCETEAWKKPKMWTERQSKGVKTKVKLKW